MNNVAIPYVYFVKNKTTNIKYIGAKYSKDSNPLYFWITYFTSSNFIKNLIKLYGHEDFEFKILKIFNNKYDALLYERKLLLIAVKRNDYANMHTNFLGELTQEEFELNNIKQKSIRSILGKLSRKNKTGFFGYSCEERSSVAQRGGFAAAKINKIRGTGIFDKTVRDKQHKTLEEKKVSAFYDPELRLEICSSGGNNGMLSHKYREKNNITVETFIKQQSDRGKKGGVKNKGGRWYNDSINEFKYTNKQQIEKSFDDFLSANKNYKKGRLKNKK